MSITGTMKKAAAQAGNANVPAAFMFGTVTSAVPLTIRVDSRFDITGDAIVLTRELRAGAYATHTHTVEPHGHAVPQHDTQPSGDGPHTHGVAPLQTGQTGLVTAPGTETYSGLAAGDKVVLLRNQGGQNFLVMGRV